jgi:hypothetical protein
MSILLMLAWLSTASAQSLLPLLSPTRVVYYGEEHYSQTHHDPLYQTLDQAVREGRLDTFATEYVPAEAQPQFTAYLTSPTAGPGSDEEEQFFRLLRGEWNVEWPDFERNRLFFRHLRELQLKHGDKLRICGVDYQDPKEIRNQFNDDDTTGPGLRAHILGIYRQLPPELLARIQSVTGQSLDELARSGETYYREAMMGKNIAECVRGSAKGSLVHMGNLHTISKNFQLPGWVYASQFADVLLGRDYVAVKNMQAYETDEFEHPDYPMNEAVVQRCELGAPVILNTRFLPPDVLTILQVQSGGETWDFSRLWDFMIFGPATRSIEAERRSSDNQRNRRGL